MGTRRSEDAETDLASLGYHARIKQAKRQAAVDAALALFLERGYAETTLQQIAARAGISTATLFKRFASKAELFEAIVLEVWTFEPSPTVPPGPEGIATGLTAIGRSIAGLMRDERTLAFYRVFIAALQQFPELGQTVLERGKLPYIRQIGEFLVLHGSFPGAGDDELEAVSSQFLAMISDQLFWPCILVPGLVITDDAAERAVGQAVTTVMARLEHARS